MLQNSFATPCTREEDRDSGEGKGGGACQKGKQQQTELEVKSHCKGFLHFNHLLRSIICVDGKLLEGGNHVYRFLESTATTTPNFSGPCFTAFHVAGAKVSVMFSCSSETEINVYCDKQVVIPKHYDCLLKTYISPNLVNLNR